MIANMPVRLAFIHVVAFHAESATSFELLLLLGCCSTPVAALAFRFNSPGTPGPVCVCTPEHGESSISFQ